ncbi:MAG: hypothetical protein LBR62_02600 [Puniceicoccales bacterium]|jgi:hypothetical protein|nr:hypothetical protein [Puniceicoccales bacterium]
MIGSWGTLLRNVVMGNSSVGHPQQPAPKRVKIIPLTKSRYLWHKEPMKGKKMLFRLSNLGKVFLGLFFLGSFLSLASGEISYDEAKEFLLKSGIFNAKDFSGIESEGWCHLSYGGCCSKITEHVNFPSIESKICALECYRVIGRTIGNKCVYHTGEEHSGCWIKVCVEMISKKIKDLSVKAAKKGEEIPEEWAPADLSEIEEELSSSSSSLFEFRLEDFSSEEEESDGSEGLDRFGEEEEEEVV